MKLIPVADKVILLAKNQNAYKSRFYLQKGLAYEFTNNQSQKALINYEEAWKYAQKAKHLKNETTILMRLNYVYYAVQDTVISKHLAAYMSELLDCSLIDI